MNEFLNGLANFENALQAFNLGFKKGSEYIYILYKKQYTTNILDKEKGYMQKTFKKGEVTIAKEFFVNKVVDNQWNLNIEAAKLTDICDWILKEFNVDIVVIPKFLYKERLGYYFEILGPNLRIIHRVANKLFEDKNEAYQMAIDYYFQWLEQLNSFTKIVINDKIVSKVKSDNIEKINDSNGIEKYILKLDFHDLSYDDNSYKLVFELFEKREKISKLVIYRNWGDEIVLENGEFQNYDRIVFDSMYININFSTEV